MRKSNFFLAAVVTLGLAKSTMFAAPVITVNAIANPKKTVQGIAVGSGYVVTVSTSDNATLTAVDLSAGSNGIFGNMFQMASSTDKNDTTATGPSATNADSHLFIDPGNIASNLNTANVLLVVSPAENNDVAAAPAGVDMSDNYYGYGNQLKGAPTYNATLNPHSSENLAYVVLRDAPSTGLVPITDAQVSSGAATSYLRVTGTAAIANQGTTPFDQLFGVLTTTTPEPASVSVLALSAVSLLRRRRV